MFTPLHKQSLAKQYTTITVEDGRSYHSLEQSLKVNSMMPLIIYISEIMRLLRIGKDTIRGISNELTLPDFFRRYDR